MLLDTNEIEIRLLQYQDLNFEYHNLLNNISEYHVNKELDNKRKKEFWDEQQKDNNYKIFIMTYQKKIIGTGSLIIQNKIIHHYSKIGYLEDIVIHPDFQKHGLGKKLILFMIENAKLIGCYKCLLNCSYQKKYFYQKCGFTKEEVNMSIYF
tara:strand:+ start:761 stop:1216 length:456 start_codon:yes stop_codon:yes gene_type:complete